MLSKLLLPESCISTQPVSSLSAHKTPSDFDSYEELKTTKYMLSVMTPYEEADLPQLELKWLLNPCSSRTKLQQLFTYEPKYISYVYA